MSAVANPSWGSTGTTDEVARVGTDTTSQQRIGLFSSVTVDTAGVEGSLLETLILQAHLQNLADRLADFYTEFSDELQDVAEAAFDAGLWLPRQDR